MKSVVVTGASTGIGWGCVKVLIKKGYKVYGSVRKKADAERLSAEFGANFSPLLFDVTDEHLVKEAAAKLGSELNGELLFGLVNNAGISVPGPLLYLPIADFERQIEVNITGQLIATQSFAPLVGADPNAKGTKGRIVNITSIGGTSATPFVGAYNVSKFGMEAMTEALRRELMIFGVDVIAVAPGAVATPIWDKADAVDVTPYENTVYGPALQNLKRVMLDLGKKGFKPERIGKTVLKALTASRPKARYVVTPDPLQHFIVNKFPKRMIDNIVAGQLGLKRKY